MIEKLSNGLTGIAGEYFVAAELSLRGFMASVTLRNNDSIDIHASNKLHEAVPDRKTAKKAAENFTIVFSNIKYA
jgi:hypothetical protein